MTDWLDRRMKQFTTDALVRILIDLGSADQDDSKLLSQGMLVSKEFEAETKWLMDSYVVPREAK